MDNGILIGGGVILILIYGFVMRAIEKRTGLNLYDMKAPDIDYEAIDSPANFNNDGYIVGGCSSKISDNDHS